MFFEFARPSAHRRVGIPRSVKPSIFKSLKRYGTPRATEEWGRSSRGDPLALQGRILSIFWRPKKASKKRRFFESPKIDQNGIVNRPLGPQCRLFDQKTCILESLLASIFDLFTKLQKRVWSLQLHRFNGFRPSKTSNFSIKKS